MDESFFANLQDVETKWREPLGLHTTFRVGGPVHCLARPQTESALALFIGKVRERQIPHFVLGGGSNLLISDDPWNGVAVQLDICCSGIVVGERIGEKVRVYAGAGVRLAKLLGFCVRNGLGGLEFMVGIPGTVGGALVMNAGTRTGTIADALIWIDVIDEDGERRKVYKSDLAPGYRSLGLSAHWVVTGACLELQPGLGAALKGVLSEAMKQRRRTQPLGWPSAGSVFKNPPGHFAGALIEKSGLKGCRIGDAEVSEKHANWIINRGSASARDILALMEHVERRVWKDSGIRLEREIRVLGF